MSLLDRTIYDVVYTAGLFDGEGNISIHKAKKKKYIEYFLDISIVNTNIQIIEYLKTKFGGNYYPMSKGKRGKKPCWRWTLSYGNAAEFIELVYPFIMVKKSDAEIALKFRDTVKGWRRITPEIMALRETYYKSMRKREKYENIPGQV